MATTLLIGLLLWAAGTAVLRFAGHGILHANSGGRALVLYAASFVLMALLAPGLFRALKLDRAAWFQAVALLTLPTLVLDAFSCLFFHRVFPNIAPAAAGVFGGWMLICCAAAVIGVWIAR